VDEEGVAARDEEGEEGEVGFAVRGK